MIPLLLSALITCIAALALGQAALRICGASSWSWMAPSVGIATLMLLALPARYLPGRAETTAVVIAILTVASVVWCVRTRAQRPPLLQLGAAAPVAALVLVPFIAAGRAGTLGVGVDNDMSLHLPFVEALISKAVANVTPLQASYPVGPHSVVAALSEGLGIRADLAFAGFTLALPVLTAWTALHPLRRPTQLGYVLVATVVGLPYLAAAYYGEGSFKELLMALLVVALALWLDRPVPAAGKGIYAPAALLVAGMVAVYSGPGLLWPAGLLGLWLVGQAAARNKRGAVGAFAAELRRRFVWVLVGLVVLLVVLVPELSVLENSFGLFHDRVSLGNLVHPLPWREALGVWDNPDFRFGASPAFSWWTDFAIALVILGVAWSIRQRRWMLPAAAGVSILIWVYSTHYESPYLSAKALVILSPLLLLLAALPLAERPRRSSFGWWAISSILAVALGVRVVDSDLGALRSSPVGPTDHLVQLRALRGELHGEPTLFLGNDDFIHWELAGVPVTTPVYIGSQLLPAPPQKQWWYGRALDIDSVSAAAINANDWVITTRDAAQSELPPQLRLVRTTADFELWRRTGVVAARRILDEGQDAGATLDCTPAVRKLIGKSGEAAVRQPSVSFGPIGAIPPGGTTTLQLSLTPGLWDLETPYQSPVPVTVSGPSGVLRRMPANLDRAGPRWPIGRIEIPSSGSMTLTIHASSSWLTPARDTADMVAIVATPVGSEHVVPLRAACGRYVDWYTNPVALTRPGDQVTEISSFPTDLEDPALQAVGFYLDGWIEQDAQLVLAGGPATTLRIEGQAVALPNRRQHLTLSINGRAIATRAVASGSPLDLRFAIPASAADRLVHLHFSSSAEIAPVDPRQATIHLTYLGFSD